MNMMKEMGNMEGGLGALAGKGNAMPNLGGADMQAMMQ